MQSLTESDFTAQPVGAGTLRVWRSRSPLATPIGFFDIDLDSPPDDALLACANHLVAAVAANTADIHEAVYESYQRTRVHKGWMRGCDVPSNLRYDRVMKYVRFRTVCVRRRDGNVVGEVFLIPAWDEEHGITLIERDGRFVRDDV